MGVLKTLNRAARTNTRQTVTPEQKLPPVFTHHSQDELKKGHKDPSQIQQPRATSSQAIWIATSNAEAKKRLDSAGKDQFLFTSNGSFVEEVLDEASYYDEEVIEEDMLSNPYNLSPRSITIRFDEYDEMQTTLHINDYTSHEIHRSWYKRDDYDKMVLLARKTAEKVEERRLEMGKVDKKRKPIEARGLEAWTKMGATKVKFIKESAIAAVWDEQSKQWDAGIYDADTIRNVYIAISQRALKTAQDRAFSDELIVKKMIEQERYKRMKKQQRKLLGKSKALVKKTAKVTTSGVVATTKFVGKTTKKTGKLALQAGKRTVKAGVATATLDPKMLKEAVKIKKKREVQRQIVRVTSQSSNMDSLKSGSGSITQSERSDPPSEELEKKKKKEKLKLLGVLSIPGTKKIYDEDRRQKKIEKRQKKEKGKASWEVGMVASGKY